MEKRILFGLFGLMSLIALSSCDDKIEYDDENKFEPVGYLVKSSINEETQASDTLQIMGIKGLIFDEIVKSDWKIITTQTINLRGTEPYEIIDGDKILSMTDIKNVIDIQTNYGTLPVAFGNMSVFYEYVGKTMELIPLENFRLIVNTEVERSSDDPYFFQYGDIVYRLYVGYIPIKVHRQKFFILDTDIMDAE